MRHWKKKPWVDSEVRNWDYVADHLLPEASAEESGKALVVGEDGTWELGDVSGGVELPSIYKEVKYIDTNGTFSYIATDYVPVQYDILTGLCSFNRQPDNSEDWVIFYAGLNTYRFRIMYGADSQGNHYFRYSNFQSNTQSHSVTQPINTWLIITANTGTGYFTMGQDTRYNAYGSTLDGNLTQLTLGATLESTAPRYDGKFGRIQIINQNSGGLKLNLVPCYRISDGEIGMYDSVSKTFYTNSGTGTLLKGDDV